MRSKSVIQRYFCMIIILIYHDCDLKKMRIQKLLNRVEKYRWIFLWTTRHKGKWFFFNISLSNVNFFFRLLFLWHVLRIVEIRVVWRRGSWVRVIQLCKEGHKIEVQTGCIFFIKIYKQVIFQHECIVSPVQYIYILIYIYRDVTSARSCNKVGHLFWFTILAQHETNGVILYIHSVHKHREFFSTSKLQDEIETEVWIE
jgi:hypothetical protein